MTISIKDQKVSGPVFKDPTQFRLKTDEVFKAITDSCGLKGELSDDLKAKFSLATNRIEKEIIGFYGAKDLMPFGTSKTEYYFELHFHIDEDGSVKVLFGFKEVISFGKFKAEVTSPPTTIKVF